MLNILAVAVVTGISFGLDEWMDDIVLDFFLSNNFDYLVIWMVAIIRSCYDCSYAEMLAKSLGFIVISGIYS